MDHHHQPPQQQQQQQQQSQASQASNKSGPASKAGPNNKMIARPSKNPFVNFMQEFSRTYKGPGGEIFVKCGQAWRGLSEREKLPYLTLARKAKKRKTSYNSRYRKRAAARRSKEREQRGSGEF